MRRDRPPLPRPRARDGAIRAQTQPDWRRRINSTEATHQRSRQPQHLSSPLDINRRIIRNHLHQPAISSAIPARSRSVPPRRLSRRAARKALISDVPLGSIKEKGGLVVARARCRRRGRAWAPPRVPPPAPARAQRRPRCPRHRRGGRGGGRRGLTSRAYTTQGGAPSASRDTGCAAHCRRARAPGSSAAARA